MDASLATLPAVQTCDLSSNNISIVQGLSTCSSLSELILSNNCIESVAQIGLCSGPLRRLVLQVRQSQTLSMLFFVLQRSTAPASLLQALCE